MHIRHRCCVGLLGIEEVRLVERRVFISSIREGFEGYSVRVASHSVIVSLRTSHEHGRWLELDIIIRSLEAVILTLVLSLCMFVRESEICILSMGLSLYVFTYQVDNLD